jgi:hypothetical protein
MFRDDINTLSRDLAKFLHSLFRGKGIEINGEQIECGVGGNVGDAALPCYNRIFLFGEYRFEAVGGP